ncbi:MAG: WecB/TagA/CpsF family glycosyltransferase, partial [Selenomonadales bacterium]|nr:WecB/TagA/CpsF family glycosyltransferase [Selenomonadales bacterium]
IVRMINDTKADFVLVALGVPKQENWITRHKDKLNASLIIGVGGTLDVMAGVVQRAPKWMQEAKLEWLFRLLCQPKRFLRMLALPRFVLAVLCAKK